MEFLPKPWKYVRHVRCHRRMSVNVKTKNWSKNFQQMVCLAVALRAFYLHGLNTCNYFPY